MGNRRKLGKLDVMVSPICFGGNVFGWTLNEQESFKILDAFVDAGFNFIDTADTYSKWVPGNTGGESETIIGKWLKRRGKRDDLVIGTKVGSSMGEDKKGLSAQYIKNAVDASLARLGTDYIDIYMSHYDDPNIKVSETITAFNTLIEEGKVRNIGASNLSAERIKDSNAFARDNGLVPYSVLQPLYNLYERERFEENYLKLVQEEELGVLSYYSLASGFLSGKYRSEDDLNKSQRGEGVKKYLNERGFNILKALDTVAKEQHATPAQIAISWQLHKDYITAPIASATTQDQLKELITAATLKLTPEQMQRLDTASEYAHNL